MAGEISIQSKHIKIQMYNNVFYRSRGATVARLTPDQKVACSNHVGIRIFFADQRSKDFCGKSLGLVLSHQLNHMYYKTQSCSVI